MYGQVHVYHVLYERGGKSVTRYRQIAVVEKEQYEVRIFEGDLVQTNPEFIADCSDAEVRLHPTLDSAKAEADNEVRESVSDRWARYEGEKPRGGC